MDAAFQSAGGRKKNYADPDRRRGKKFQLLERYGEPDSRRGVVLLENGKTRLAEERCRRREVSDGRQSDHRARQNGVRQLLCALSFEQGSRCTGECQRLRLESILGMD